MALEPWYKVSQPRGEVREGRSVIPGEFAIWSRSSSARHRLYRSLSLPWSSSLLPPGWLK